MQQVITHHLVFTKLLLFQMNMMCSSATLGTVPAFCPGGGQALHQCAWTGCDPYFCVSGSFCQIWLKRPSPCCDILTEMSSRARRNHPRPEADRDVSVGPKPNNVKRGSGPFALLTLTPATRTPSADFTTFLKKSSSFSFLFFPRTLSYQGRKVKSNNNNSLNQLYLYFSSVTNKNITNDR